jgi:hypothetical protein
MNMMGMLMQINVLINFSFVITKVLRELFVHNTYDHCLCDEAFDHSGAGSNVIVASYLPLVIAATRVFNLVHNLTKSIYLTLMV